MEDNEIVGLFFKRDESAISEVKSKYGARLFKTALNILKTDSDADECVSDTLYKAWENIPPAEPEHLGAYLAKITRNLSLNRYQSDRAAKRGSGEMPILLSELEDCIPSTAQPDLEIEAAEVEAQINVFLSKCDDEARNILVLRYFHGESVKDISLRFKLSESKVKSVLFRARKKLAEHLQKEGITL